MGVGGRRGPAPSPGVPEPHRDAGRLDADSARDVPDALGRYPPRPSAVALLLRAVVTAGAEVEERAREQRLLDAIQLLLRPDTDRQTIDALRRLGDPEIDLLLDRTGIA